MDLRALLIEYGAWRRDGHYVLDNGDHSREFVSAELGIVHREARRALAQALADLVPRGTEFLAAYGKSDYALMAATSMRLDTETGRLIAIAGCEQVDGEPAFNSSFASIMQGRRVTIVGFANGATGCIGPLSAAVEAAGARLHAAVTAIRIGRSVYGAIGGKPVLTAIDDTIETYAEESCPLCQAGIPVNEDFGHGKEFMESRRLFGD